MNWDLQYFLYIAFPARIAKLCVDAGKLWDREVGDRPRDNYCKDGRDNTTILGESTWPAILNCHGIDGKN